MVLPRKSLGVAWRALHQYSWWAYLMLVATQMRAVVGIGEGVVTATSTAEYWSDPVPMFELMDSTETIYSVAFSFDAQWLATGSSDKKVRVYKLNGDDRPTLAYTLTDARDYVNSVAYSSDGKWLAAASLDKMVRLYRWTGDSEPSLAYTMKDARDFLWNVVFSYDSQWMATGSSDKNARIYSVYEDKEPVLRFTLQSIRSDRPYWDQSDALYTVAFSPDGRWFGCGSSDRHVRLYAISGDDKPVLRATLKSATAPVYSVSFSYDNRWVATGSSDEKVRLYLLDQKGDDEPVLKHTIRDFTGPIRSVVFSYDSKRLAVGSLDKQVRIYSLHEEDKPLYKNRILGLDNVWSVAFSYNMRWFASGSSNRTARVYKLGGANDDLTWQLSQATITNKDEQEPDLAQVSPSANDISTAALVGTTVAVAVSITFVVRRVLFSFKKSPLNERLVGDS